MRANLPAAVEIVDTHFAMGAADGEIADSRDFLLGADDGGLVVALPDGSWGRAPYLLPYVDPEVRAGLPDGTALSFSAAMWEHNVATFGPTDRRVADLPAPAAAVVRIAGHDDDARVADVCAHHAAVLRSLLASG